METYLNSLMVATPLTRSDIPGIERISQGYVSRDCKTFWRLEREILGIASKIFSA
ncbi:hypothetical protein KAM546c_36650 [Enterobacter roggenkampii]|nr:hypothetical protein KAM546c_36650 [Enterobacter roggenkampii]